MFNINLEKSGRLIHLERELSKLKFNDALRMLDLAERKMGHIKRHDGKSYTTHLYDVMLILINSGYTKPQDEKLIIAAGGHDLVEDTDVTVAMLVELFDEDVADTISRVTKKKGVDYKVDLAEMEIYVKTFFEKRDSLLCKIADRLGNFTTMSFSSPSHRRKQLKETKEIYLPVIKMARKVYPQDEGFLYMAQTVIEPLIAEYEREIRLMEEHENQMKEKDLEIAELKKQLQDLSK